MRFDVVSLGDHLPDPHSGVHSQTQAERYRTLVELGVQAEALGYGALWLGEHHASEYILPSPQLLLAAIAERTQSIRLGTAVTLLQTNDPVRIAEDFASLDLLSGGRAEIGFGSGISRLVYQMFAQRPEDASEVSGEFLDLLQQLWSGAQIDWKGRFRTPLSGVRLAPRTYSGTAIPIHLGVTRSEANAREAGRRGLGLMLGTVVGRFRDFRPLADAYRSSYREAGHDPAGMNVAMICIIHADADGDRARARWAPYRDNYVAFRMKQLLSNDSLIALPPPGPGSGPPPRPECELCGTPAEIADGIRRANDDVGGADSVQCGFDLGALPPGEVFRSMELFANEVVSKLSSEL